MEIIVRAAVLFVFLWIVTRVAGRSTLGELSTFQLLLYVVMGDLIQQGVTQQDYSVTGAVLAIGTFLLLTTALSYANWRWPKLRPFVHGRPVIIVRDGSPLMDAMRTERLSIDDLAEAAREQGIGRFSEIALAVLEANGKISFFRADGAGEDGAPETAPAS